MDSTSPNERGPVLVITDVFPDADDTSRWLTQILRGLVQPGRHVTLLIRDARKTGDCSAAWLELGKAPPSQSTRERVTRIQVCPGDNQRLAALGVETPDLRDSLAGALEQNDFSLAFLAQNFSQGISVPEHYLDDIRKLSPHTRIAVLSEELHGRGAVRRAEVTQRQDHYEQAQDYSEREWESFERADLVVVSHPQDAALLFEREPLLPVAVVPHAVECSGSAGDWKSRGGVLLPLDLKRPGDVDAFVWFIEKGWPILHRRAPEIELLIAGGDEVPLESRQKLPGVKWFSADEMDKVAMSARLFLAPLRFGVSRSTLLKMLGYGLPGIATSFATDAAALTPESGLLSAHSAEECAHAAIRLHASKKLWETLARKECAFIREHHSRELQAGQTARALDQLEHLVPKPVAPSPPSVLLVDLAYSEALRRAPARQRISLRLDFHVRLARRLLHEGKPREAREQLRHAYSRLGESAKPELPLAMLLGVLARCYRELGDPAMVLRCGQEARKYFCKQAPAAKPSATAAIRSNAIPEISLIVPTFNRLPILRKCLAALEAQTVSSQDFEVIVIDDGSSDGTEDAMRSYQPRFGFQYLRQSNSGTGAARRNGVEHAGGEYLLLMNDDTLCQPDVIEQHLAMQKNYAAERWAILGSFEYPREARRRAMTHFLHESSFMFPQVEMEEGFPYPYSHFITCNLSVRRGAVVEAGSFDPTYKLSEDTELGVRLLEMGYGVLYHPAAHAWHDHLPYTVSSLIRRARVYGADYFYMFRRHPRVIREWVMPIRFEAMDASAAPRIQTYLAENRGNVEAAVAALSSWDSVEFEPILERPKDAAHILALFQQAVPAIHWFHVFESMLETMSRELGVCTGPAHMRLVMSAAQGSAI